MPPDFKECWFSLIQKSMNVAAATLESVEDLRRLQEMNNSYVSKEVIERYLKGSVMWGIVNVPVFEEAMEIFMAIKRGDKEEIGIVATLN